MIRRVCVALALMISPAVAQPYSGPPDGADYWTVPAYKDFPLKGPQAARGVVLWSHGVYRREAQYQYPPNLVVRRFATAGWDVVKVQRNPRNERGWIPTGIRHVADLTERANKAKAEGYKLVIAAGQSYGGAISIEAAGRTTAIDGVLAMAPGHGSDAANGSTARMFDGLTDQLIEAIKRSKTPRLVVMIAENDIYHPFEVRGPKLRAALTSHGMPFVLFDETMPLKGHGAGATTQFDQWYGACVVRFLTEATAKSGETKCPGPVVAGKFVLPADMKVGAPAPDIPSNMASLAGSWSGLLGESRRPVKLVFEQIDANRATFIYALGPEGTAQPSYARRTGNWDRTAFISKNATGQFSISVTPPTDAGVIALIVTGEKGTVWTAELRREALAGLSP